MTHAKPTERERGGGTGDTPTERENWPHEAFKLIFFRTFSVFHLPHM